MRKKIEKITILGDGGWGTTLAIHLQRKGLKVKVWGPFPDYIFALNKMRINKKFLPGIHIPKSIIFSADIKESVISADVIVLAIPSKFVKKVIHRLKGFDLSQKIFLSVVKGIENKSLLRISQIIKKELPKVSLAVLSGPTIADEVARGIPSTAVIASNNLAIAKPLQEIFNSDYFRIYTNRDVVGVEVGGSVKNVIAIACGVCDGLGLGTNAKAAILSRGLAEITRLGIKLGAKAETFAGLSGLGDLATTCFSPQSRNRLVGEKLGKGRSLKNITSKMTMIAEGITTVKAIYNLSLRHQISMPITTEVYRIIYKNKSPRKAVADLMGRKLKAE